MSERELWPEEVGDSIPRAARPIKIVYLPIAGAAFILRVPFINTALKLRQPMAFCIFINKVSETADEAIYEFWEEEADVGCLKLDKIAGMTFELRQISSANAEAIFTRASWKVLQHFLAGEFPEKTCWAS